MHSEIDFETEIEIEKVQPRMYLNQERVLEEVGQRSPSMNDFLPGSQWRLVDCLQVIVPR